jgi:hypothetical protein
MTDDPIVEEVRRAREALAAQEGNDLRRMVAAARRRQALSGQKVVRLEPRRVKAAKNKTA